MHQGSALSPMILMEALSIEFRVTSTLPCKLLYADDLVVIAETEDNID